MINPTILHVYGPLSIHAYGLCIALGAIIAIYLLYHDKKTLTIIPEQDLLFSLQLIIVTGYLGGRILYMLSEYQQTDTSFLYAFWQPGLSIMGTIIAIAISLTLFLYVKKIKILQYLDRIALYAPLVQSFGRLGCFFSGCCFGQKLNNWWAVVYNHPEHMAPLHTALHPTQLYSSFLLLIIFIYLYFYAQHRLSKPGLLLCLYLMLVSSERFIVDFVRWDRSWIIPDTALNILSINQWVAVGVALAGCIGFIVLKRLSGTKHGSI